LLLLACNSLLYYPNDRIYKKGIPEKYERVYLHSKSGNTLHSVYMKSERPVPKAVVVHFHGNARNISAHYRAFEWLLAYGYDLISWDYSGYGESTGSPSPEAIYNDSLTVLEYAAALKKEKGCGLIVIGQSIGGAILLGALEGFAQREQIDLVVADCTFSSYKKIADFQVKNAVRIPIPVGVTISDTYAPINNFAAIRDLPILVSHCREDKVIPFPFGEKLYGELENSEKWFWELSCKHTAGYWKKENQERLVKFFDDRLSR